jgi:hypothetical protein
MVFLFNFRYQFRRKKYFLDTLYENVLLEALYRLDICKAQRSDVPLFVISVAAEVKT